MLGRSAKIMETEIVQVSVGQEGKSSLNKKLKPRVDSVRAKIRTPQ